MALIACLEIQNNFKRLHCPAQYSMLEVQDISPWSMLLNTYYEYVEILQKFETQFQRHSCKCTFAIVVAAAAAAVAAVV